ncbi:MAG: DinB family protein [Chloroflexi bacterium AL-W]|nr:DinB family protein [Chloroflexi bacterium AL-N1]NOK66030.1 DinB family protein [Chloroflexi bacterium AL-N10]NOK72911.1 DinB family protein [Chloroflexi bacterium AL-N5]NOK79808.1 DinB family protein [Chloroflexi bacterium AL-W]NOK88336.1 DinB family protein [Chloroflexi bacterium AL-N15]
MNSLWKTSLWQQFGAAIDMLDDAIGACPERLWTANLWDDEDDPAYGQFWYLAYHTLSWLDLFLSDSSAGFTPPAPFIRGALPEKPYPQTDVSTYLKQCRQQCEAVINALTDEQAQQLCTFDWMEPTFLELQLYSMRHVQEHASQLSFFLGTNGVLGIDWVAQARSNPTSC